jgi:MFS family permease
MTLGSGPETEVHPPSWRDRATLPVLVSVAALVAVVTSLGAPLIPSIAQSDHISLSTAEWVLTSALMTGALATPTMGRLADGPHKRKVIEIALAVVLLGCVLSAVSHSFIVLVLGRGMQGIGLGLLPVTMAIARSQFSTERSGRAIAALSVSAAVGAGLGYPLTSLIAQFFDYHAAFWFGAITVSIAFCLVLIVLPSKFEGKTRDFDYIGMVTLGSAVVGVSVLLSEGGEWGWTNGRSLGLLAFSLVTAIVWVSHELRVPDPLIDVRQVRNRSVLTADASAFMIAVAMYLFLPVIIEFVQLPRSSGYGFGDSILVSGLVLVPLSLGSFVSSRCLIAFTRRFGSRGTIPFGSVMFAAGPLLFALEHRGLWEAFLTAGLAGIGIGFTYAAMPGFIVRAVPLSETGSAMGLYQVLRSIGLSLGSALAAAVLTSYTSSGHTYPAFQGFRITLLIAAGLCLTTAVFSFVLPGTPPELPQPLNKELENLMRGESKVEAVGLMLSDTGPIIASDEGSQ